MSKRGLVKCMVTDWWWEHGDDVIGFVVCAVACLLFALVLLGAIEVVKEFAAWVGEDLFYGAVIVITIVWTVVLTLYKFAASVYRAYKNCKWSDGPC